MKTNDLKNLSAARRLVRQITAESCTIYNSLCATECEQTAYRVLDGQLRMASKLAAVQNSLNDE